LEWDILSSAAEIPLFVAACNCNHLIALGVVVGYSAPRTAPATIAPPLMIVMMGFLSVELHSLLDDYEMSQNKSLAALLNPSNEPPHLGSVGEILFLHLDHLPLQQHYLSSAEKKHHEHLYKKA
jgi:hypothetical protein